MNVEDTVRDIWATRPRRGADRKVAGVAGAIGRRYAIDPVLVRVAFVVTTFFGGVGVLLYLLGWLLLPGEGDEVSAAESLLGRGRSSMSPVLTVCLGLALIPAGAAVFGGDPGGLVALALCAGALFLLHRNRAAAGELPVAGPTTSTAATPATGATGSEPTAPLAEGARPPAWDPLGVAPFAWDLPEPGPAPPPPPPTPRGPRSKVTPVTLGFALLAGGIASAFLPAITPAQIAGVVLGVIGLGLVVGSLLRGGRGLIVVAIPLALAAWVLQAAAVPNLSAGEQRWNAATPAQLQPRYDLGAGSGHLDLTDLTTPDGRTLRTSVAVSLGEAKVFLPPDVDVQLHCAAQVGDVNCLGRTASGIGTARVDLVDEGRDGPGGGRIVLDVRAGTGNVAVSRG
ncbi:MAG: PspC domain-containing protein [Pseudonocardiaceae bacterium]